MIKKSERYYSHPQFDCSPDTKTKATPCDICEIEVDKDDEADDRDENNTRNQVRMGVWKEEVGILTSRRPKMSQPQQSSAPYSYAVARHTDKASVASPCRYKY
jgi:hypothetical protein